MNGYAWLSSFEVMIFFELCFVSVNGEPSCKEFGGKIKGLDFVPADRLDNLAVALAAENHLGPSFTYCSLFNNLPGCGSIRIKGNIFENGSVTISGWNAQVNRGEHYTFHVKRRESTKLHIYDFKSANLRYVTFNEEGFWNQRRENYDQLPQYIRDRHNFTVALVAANTSNPMTGVGFRFCQAENIGAGDKSNLAVFFRQSGFVAFDTRHKDIHATIVKDAVNSSDLFSQFVRVPLDKYPLEYER